jgi:hypothetical protein
VCEEAGLEPERGPALCALVRTAGSVHLLPLIFLSTDLLVSCLSQQISVVKVLICVPLTDDISYVRYLVLSLLKRGLHLLAIFNGVLFKQKAFNKDLY